MNLKSKPAESWGYYLGFRKGQVIVIKICTLTVTVTISKNQPYNKQFSLSLKDTKVYWCLLKKWDNFHSLFTYPELWNLFLKLLPWIYFKKMILIHDFILQEQFFKKMILIHDFILQEQFFKKIAQLFQDGGLDMALTDMEDEQLLFSYSKWVDVIIFVKLPFWNLCFLFKSFIFHLKIYFFAFILEIPLLSTVEG